MYALLVYNYWFDEIVCPTSKVLEILGSWGKTYNGNKHWKFVLLVSIKLSIFLLCCVLPSGWSCDQVLCQAVIHPDYSAQLSSSSTRVLSAASHIAIFFHLPMASIGRGAAYEENYGCTRGLLKGSVGTVAHTSGIMRGILDICCVLFVQTSWHMAHRPFTLLATRSWLWYAWLVSAVWIWSRCQLLTATNHFRKCFSSLASLQGIWESSFASVPKTCCYSGLRKWHCSKLVFFQFGQLCFVMSFFTLSITLSHGFPSSHFPSSFRFFVSLTYFIVLYSIVVTQSFSSAI